MSKPVRRPMRAVRSVDVEAALEQARAFLVGRDLATGVFSCAWCGEPATMTMTLFGPLLHAQVACAACGVKAIEEAE